MPMIDFYDPYDMTPYYDPYKGMSDEERMMQCCVQTAAKVIVFAIILAIGIICSWIF